MGYPRPRLIDWGKNNKIVLRNPSNKAFDFHEMVKQAIVLSLRKIHQDSAREPIETEKKVGDQIADVWMRTRNGDIYVWEIQTAYTEEWEMRLTRAYTEMSTNFIPVKLKDIEKKWIETCFENPNQNPIKSLFEILDKEGKIL